MAGRSRTVDTGRTDGRRRLRQHRPAGEAEPYRREKALRGARAQVDHRIRQERDPLRQLDAARDYVRSATRKYQPGGDLAPVIEALLTAGDAIYRNGTPRDRQNRR
ncbi:hypothetical protein GCM10027174_44880 [Salinifilum aidingensis]